MTAMFIGLVSAYIGSYIGGFVSGNGMFSFSGSFLPLIVVAVSGCVMAGFVYLAEKKNMAWVESFFYRLQYAHRHGCSRGRQAVYIERRKNKMERNSFEQYNSRTHTIGRISSVIVLVMLVGAPF